MIYRNLISRYIENFDISAGDTIRYDISISNRYFRYIDTALVLTAEEGDWILSSLFEHANFEDGVQWRRLGPKVVGRGQRRKINVPKISNFGGT